MKPFFFGASTTQLFGAYHPPARGASSRGAGVVLCYPAPQEYMFAHWSFRRLAEALARQGFHALRFDYFGTGDSAGDLSAATLAQWRADVSTAADELRDLAGVSKVSAVGMRLGAALALAASAKGERFHDLVLWDPLLDGRADREALRAIERRKLAMRHVYHPQKDDELMGFVLPRAMREEIDALDLVGEVTRGAKPDAARATLAIYGETAETRALQAALAAKGVAVQTRVVRDDEAAAKREALDEALVSNAMTDAIVQILAGPQAAAEPASASAAAATEKR